MVPNYSCLDLLVADRLFCAKSLSMPCIICLVIEVTDREVAVRAIGTGIELQFDITTGQAQCKENGEVCSVHSIDRLPEDREKVLLSMDRRFRSFGGDKKYKLLETEKDTLVFVQKFWKT